jgi:hypothetical protein
MVTHAHLLKSSNLLNSIRPVINTFYFIQMSVIEKITKGCNSIMHYQISIVFDKHHFLCIIFIHAE